MSDTLHQIASKVGTVDCAFMAASGPDDSPLDDPVEGYKLCRQALTDIGVTARAALEAVPDIITIVSFDDWQAVYLNGDEVAGNHSIATDEILSWTHGRAVEIRPWSEEQDAFVAEVGVPQQIEELPE